LPKWQKKLSKHGAELHVIYSEFGVRVEVKVPQEEERLSLSAWSARLQAEQAEREFQQRLAAWPTRILRLEEGNRPVIPDGITLAGEQEFLQGLPEDQRRAIVLNNRAWDAFQAQD
jgi:hypothetical protein